MPASLRVLIVGGGIAGLALGRALRERGFAPEIIERAASWPTTGAGLYLPGNGVRALRALGLADKLLAKAVHIRRQRILDHAGRHLADVDLTKVWSPVGPCVSLGRREFHRILLDGAAGIPMRLDTTVSAVIQARSGAVGVTYADGSTGEYDIVVGADGIRSSIRELIFRGSRPRNLGQVSWRFLVDRSNEMESWTAMLGRGRAFLRIPVAPDRVYCYADVASHAQDDPTGRDLGRLRALFADFAEPVPSILRQLDSFESIYFAPIEEIVLETWVEGRVVLIGDAAHATSPNMAEGASMALEDALLLADMLAAHRSPLEALRTFNERRRARSRWVRQRTHRRDRIRALPVPLRNLALRLAGAAVYRQDYQPLFDEP